MRATRLGLGLVLGLLLASSCRGTGSEPPQSGRTIPTAATTEPDPTDPQTVDLLLESRTDALVQGLTLVEDDRLEFQVILGACQRLAAHSETTADGVIVGVWQVDDPSLGTCPDIGTEATVPLTLDRPLGSQPLVLIQPEGGPSSGFDPIAAESTCLRVPGEILCRELTVRIGDEDRIVNSFPAILPGGRDLFSSAPTEFGADQLGFRLTIEPPFADDAVVVVNQSLWQPESGLWGSIVVHNLDDVLQGFEPREAVAGFDARSRSVLDAPGVEIVAILVDDAWIVEVTLFGRADVDLEAEREALLANLQIDRSRGQIPVVTDSRGGGSVFGELGIVDRRQSFYLNPWFNCDADEVHCRPGAGYLFGGATPVFRIDGTDPEAQIPQLPNGYEELPLPSGVEVEFTEFGRLGELVSCEGVPAFDPTLLPRQVSLGDASAAVLTYTGLDSWQFRARPGIETHFIGSAQDPETVARYEQAADGTWQTVSVVSCR